MPVLDNPKHERFAQELAKGKTADEAYQLAGYKADRCHASRLAAKGNVRARVTEILERSARRAEVTVGSLLAELDEARALAFHVEQPSAAVAATREKAVLVGLRVEKSERRNVSDPRTLSGQDLDQALSEALARAEAEERGPGLTH